MSSLEGMKDNFQLLLRKCRLDRLVEIVNKKKKVIFRIWISDNFFTAKHHCNKQSSNDYTENLHLMMQRVDSNERKQNNPKILDS